MRRFATEQGEEPPGEEPPAGGAAAAAAGTALGDAEEAGKGEKGALYGDGAVEELGRWVRFSARLIGLDGMVVNTVLSGRRLYE